ncbi:hypothetical protein ACFLQR_03525, partial [Verrucomicrobiota bacterium]
MGEFKPFLSLSAGAVRELRGRIEKSEYLGRYWEETVLPGLALEAGGRPPDLRVESPAASAIRMAFAWRLTGEDAYAEIAREKLGGIPDDVPESVLKGGSRIIQLVTALSWLREWPGLTRETLARIESLVAGITETMASYLCPELFGRLEVNRGENWDSQVIAGLGIAACCLTQHPRRSEWLRQAEMSAAAWLGRRAEDGALCEGTINYQLYALGNMTRLADALR